MAGTLVLFFFWAVVWIISTIGNNVQKSNNHEKYMNRLAPNGYALEYQIATKHGAEIYECLLKLEREVGKDAAWSAIRREIYKRTAKYPTIQRYLDKSGMSSWDMMRHYAAYTARIETVMSGKHPMVTGGIDPTPLPEDDSYAILKGKTPLPQFGWYVFNEEVYRNLLRQDEASEREYERRMIELARGGA